MKKTTFFALLILMSLFVLTSCDNSKFTETQALELINAKFNDSEGETKWVHLKLNLGKKTVKKGLTKRSSKKHNVLELDLCHVSINTEEGTKDKIFVLDNNCNGCLLCLDMYKKAGLINYELIRERRIKSEVNISLTEKGNEYVMIKSEKSAYIRFGKIKALNAFEISLSKNRANCKYTSCYYDLTPFGEALGGENNIPLIVNSDNPEKLIETSEKFIYYEDKGWVIK